MREIKQLLNDTLKYLETKEVASIFEQYMESIGAKPLNSKNEGLKNTFLIDGKSTNWNRVECFHYNTNDTKFGSERLDFTMRKRAGYYLLLQRGDNRFFETDGSESFRWNDETTLNKVVAEYNGLFDLLEDKIKEKEINQEINLKEENEKLKKLFNKTNEKLFDIRNNYSMVVVELEVLKMENNRLKAELEKSIQLPCNVGDILYSTTDGRLIELEVLSVKYECEAENYGKFIREKIVVNCQGIATELNWSDIGKIVFYSKEQALQDKTIEEPEQER